MEHVFRVYNNCLRIAKTEKNVDIDVLQVATLLHEIARVKEDNCQDRSIDHAILESEMAIDILKSFNLDNDFIEKVSSALRTHRFKVGLIPESLEAKILFDADKLDVIGNIGICRTYMIAGEFKKTVFNDCDLEQYIATNLIGG